MSSQKTNNYFLIYPNIIMPSTREIEIKQKIIKLFHEHFIDWNGVIEAIELFKLVSNDNKEENLFLQIIDNLSNEGKLERRSFHSFLGASFNDILKIRFKALLDFERNIKKDKRIITKQTLGMLFFFNEIDSKSVDVKNNEIELNEISDCVKKELNIDMNSNIIRLIWSELESLYCSNQTFSYSLRDERLRFFDSSRAILTSEGTKYLEFQLKLQNLFQTKNRSYCPYYLGTLHRNCNRHQPMGRALKNASFLLLYEN